MLRQASRTGVIVSLFTLHLAFLAAGQTQTAPQTASAKSGTLVANRLNRPVDDKVLSEMRGTVHPLARRENDRGPVADGMQLDRVQVLLKRSDAQEAALTQLIGDLHKPGSAAYHRWLTPEEFGQQFGPSDEDIATLSGWLQRHGFGGIKLNPGRQTLEFTGSAARFREAFHSEIHRYWVNGETHFANATEPKIPAALAPVFGGFVSLNNFRLHSAIKKMGRATYAPATRRTKLDSKPAWTIGGDGAYYFVLAPGDFAVQYNLNPLYSAGTDGTGQTIAIINESNIDLSLVNDYRILFGLPANTPQVIIDGNDPGIDGVNNPDGPNYASTEAYLDVEVAGAVAPKAKIDLVIGADTALESGLSLAAEHAVYANLAPVMSLSFGTCERALGASNQFWKGLWEQAAAQGITVMVSAGDGGSAGCDDFDTQYYAVYGQAVNGLASTPYNVAVGGTDFYYSSSADLLNYWTNDGTNFPSSATPATSLLGPVPEQAWNDSQYGLNTFTYESYDGLATEIVAGGGGGSDCGQPTTDANGAITACAPYYKPTWQTGAGLPTDSVRDLPDVSLFAADGANLSFYPICAYPGDCESGSDSLQFSGVGGTSAASPAFAGIMALVNQKTGSRQGQADFVLYPLATQYPNSFHDVTLGTNAVPCNVGVTSNGYSPTDCIAVSNPITTTHPFFGTATEGEIGKGTTPEYNAGVGYDLATGLGSVDAYNLVNNWSKVAFNTTTTTLTPSSTSFAHGTAITVSGSVTGTTSPLPTGQVALMTTSTEPLIAGDKFYNLKSGSYTGANNHLPGGNYSIYGQYSGDSLNAASASTPVAVTVTPETSSLTLDLLSSTSQVSLAAASSIPYGTQVLLSGEPVPLKFYNSNSACIQGGTVPSQCASPNFETPTGTVAFTDSGAALNKAALNAEGDAEYNAVFGVGAHSVAAAYSGDASYGAVTSPAVAFTVVKDVPVIGAISGPTPGPGNTFPAGVALSFSFGVENFANGAPAVGVIYSPAAAPTGTLTFTGAPAGAPASVTLSATTDPGTTYPEGVATATIPATAAPGTYNVTIAYSGDANYAATSLNKTVTLVAQPIISTIAGNGIAGLGGDGGPATSAEISNSQGSALDSAGNLYIADSFNGRVRKVTKSTGAITTVAGGGSGGDGGPATSALLYYPTAVAVDASGNLYIADSGNNKIRTVSASTGIISTFAGNGTYGSSGDGGAATSAEIGQVFGLAFDTAGNLYMADPYNNRIRRVSASTGNISTVAGTGTQGFLGDGGLATAAELYLPFGVAVDASGNLFIADTYNYRVREVTAATGVIATIAGNGGFGSGGDGGAAVAAEFENPTAVSVDASGDVFIADYFNAVIREVAAGSGTISTVAGNHVFGYSGDGGPAIGAELSLPTGILVDASGNLFITDQDDSVVREVSAASAQSGQTTGVPVFTPTPGTYQYPVTVSLTDGTPNATIYYTLDGSAPTTASSVFSGSLFLSTSTVIRAMATASGLSPSAPTAGTYALPPAAPVFTPAGGTYSSAQTVTLTDTTPGAFFNYTTDGSDPLASSTTQYYSGPITVSASETVRAIAYSSSFPNSPGSAETTTSYVISATPVIVPNYVISTVAGNGIEGTSGDGGVATDAEISYSQATAVDAAGNLYIADLDNSRIRKVTRSTGVITTVAGTGSYGYSGDGGAATKAKITYPTGIAVDAAGDIYFTDYYNFRVRKVTAGTGIITTVVGNGTMGSSGDGGLAISAEIGYTYGLALDGAGNLFLADGGNSRIREVAAATGVITTVAGDGTPGYSGDGGLATAAEVYFPISVAVDPAGNVYIADTDNQVVREVSAASGTIATIAGTGSYGYSGDNGLATAAQLAYPQGVGVDSAGDVFIADTSNNVVREVIAGTGVIATVAGVQTARGYGGDGGPALAAQLFYPTGLALDSAGDIFISDSYNYVVRALSLASGAGPQVTATPTFTPAPGTYNAAISVTLADATPNATIYYTLDGTTPTTSSSVYSAPIALSTPTIVRAFATAPSLTASLPTAAGYQLPPAAPVFTPAAGSYGAAQTVAITDATPNTYIIYTTDGSSPDTSSSAQYYSGPVTVSFNETLTAIAYGNGNGLASPVSSASYVITGNPINGAERVIATVAGDGKGGFSGDGGQAINSQLFFPGGEALDSAGNLYIADTNNCAVRKVNKSTGVITTVAGIGGNCGFSGDGAAAQSAQLGYLGGVAVDASGNIYIADTYNFVIRKVTPSTGIIVTVAGNGKYGSSGDGGPATSAALNYPNGVAVDGAGNIYIADSGNSEIRKVTATTGIITTVAGDGSYGYSGDSGAATAAELGYPSAVTVDAANNLYIADADFSVIRKVTAATGVIRTIAGNGSYGYTGDGGPATNAELGYPLGVGLDSSGNVYIADSDNGVVREVIKASGVIVTVAGDGGSGYSGDGGPAVNAQISYPSGVVTDSAGDLFLVDSGNSAIREVFTSTASSATVTATPAFTPVPGAYSSTLNVTITDSTSGATIYYTTDGSAPTTSSSVYGTAVPVSTSTVFRAMAKASGYTASAPTAASYLLPPATPTFSPAGGTYASTQTVTITDATPGTYIYYTTDGSDVFSGGGKTNFYSGPITVNASQTLKAIALSEYFYGPQSAEGTATYVIPADNVISTVAGNGTAGNSGAGGPATSAELYGPDGIAFDKAGNLYFSDFRNCQVDKVDASGTITIIAGTGTRGYSGDGGAATGAELNHPQGLAFDSAGDLYITDGGGSRIRMVTPGGIISTVAGDGKAGFSGDGGAATSAELAYSGAVAFDSTGNFYIADYSNNRVRKVDTSGIITTVAGNGTAGDTGDGGSALAAELNLPQGIAVDGTGNIYVAELGGNVIRKVDTTGTISTVAGNGIAGYRGDGGSAQYAELNSPNSVHVDAGGNLYIADSNNSVIRKVTPAGTISTIAGNGVASFAGDGGPALAAELNAPADAALDPSGNLYIADFSNYRIRKVTYLRPVGNLEQAVDATTKSTTVPATDTVFISGWVADPVDGSPMSNVHVLIDGTDVGTPTLGVARPDVSSYFNQPTYANSGFRFGYAASSLSPGSHSVTVVAVDSNGLSTTLGPLTFSVTAVYPPPIGNLESAVDASTATATVTTGDNLRVSGWVADPTDGSPMKNVQVLIDGTAVGTPTLGIARPDVAAYFNNPAYANSGFVFSYNASLLTAGAHAVTVVAVDAHGVSTTFGPLTFTLKVVNKPPVGNLELAVDSVTVKPTISQSGTLFVSGWAADYQDNGAAQSVQILIDGAAAGSATLGQARPDVAAYFGNPAWGKTGYTFTMAASGLGIGTHSVTAVATDSLKLTTTFGPLTITVTK